MSIKSLNIPNIITIIYFAFLFSFHGLFIYNIFEGNMLLTSLVFISIYAIKRPLIKLLQVKEEHINTIYRFLSLLTYVLTSLFIVLRLTSIVSDTILVTLMMIWLIVVSMFIMNNERSDFFNLVMITIVAAFFHITSLHDGEYLLIFSAVILVKTLDNIKNVISAPIAFGTIPLFV